MTSFKNDLKTLFSTRKVLQLQGQLNKLFVKSFNQELGLKSLALWQWCRKMNFLDNVFKNKLSTYLFNNIILATQNGKLETCIIYQTGMWDLDFVKNLDFSTPVITEWCQEDISIPHFHLREFLLTILLAFTVFLLLNVFQSWELTLLTLKKTNSDTTTSILLALL